MKPIFIPLLALALFLSSCSSTPELKELKIQENDECSLSSPSQMATAADSCICIVDRSRSYKIDSRSGMIDIVGIDDISREFAEFLAKISGQPLTDSTPIQPLALLGYGDKCSNALYAYALPLSSNRILKSLPL